MNDDSTLGGYFRVHERPPAFESTDGQPYSVALYVDEAPDATGRYGGALLFIRWSPAGDQPVGHLETEYLAHGGSPAEVDERLRSLTLHQVKEQLDLLVRRASGLPAW
jgi:hypothetical protein